jgi:predicted TIM-barrel fold metal-dependent hydrolase
MMKEEGIDKTVLFSTVIHPEKADSYEELKSELSKLDKILSGEINPLEARIAATAELKQIVDANPERYIGFGPCPVGLDLSSTEKWIEKYVTGNSFKGIGEIVVGEGGTGSMENIFKATASLRDLPLWIHTFNPLSATDIRAVLEMCEKYPSVKVIFGHGGGSHWNELLEKIKKHKNIYFDISATFTTVSVKAASQIIPDRVLFSADMPFNTYGVMKKIVYDSVDSERIREMIFSENILQLLGN